MQNTIGERIKAARERRVYGRTELAKLAGLTYISILRIETGQRQPRPATIRKIAGALGVDPITLVNEKDAAQS